jgi:hypothetical protein
MTEPTPMTGITAIERLRRKAAQRYTPLPFEYDDDTYYFRRLDGEQMDTLVQLQASEPQISNVKYRAHAVAMSFVDESGTPLTWQEALKIGSVFCLKAGDFVLRISSEDGAEEAAAASDELPPFIEKPGIPTDSPAPSDAPALKSVSSRK